MKPSQATSEGARYERRAFRERLRRSIKYYQSGGLDRYATSIIQVELNWVLTRQKRYDAKPGGLGKE